MINIFNKKPQDFKFLEAFEILNSPFDYHFSMKRPLTPKINR